MMHGVLLVDKPEGITSTEVVRIVKRRVKPAKVGHTGTLDPAASGLLVILIGAATRALDYLDETRKKYDLTVKLGEETDTCDKEGQVLRSADASGITLERIEEVLQRYRGVIEQVPPHYSAAKKNGVALYKLARKGVLVDLPPRKIEVFSFIVVDWKPPLLGLELVCSKGTYARALARDIGRDLEVGGRLENLRRAESGAFRVEDALPLIEISDGAADTISRALISLPVALSHIPTIPVMIHEVRRLMRGSQVRIPASRLPVTPGVPAESVQLLKIVSPNQRLLILVSPGPARNDVSLHTLRVFQTLDDE